MAALDGKAIAFICRGSEADRAIAIALAEAGADIALSTVTPAHDEEFATASIANEVWAMGREQFNRVVDMADPAAAAAFAAEVCDTLGSCDGVVFAPGPAPVVEFDELSRDEWEPMVTAMLTAPLVGAQAFSRVLERAGGGTVVFVVDSAEPRDVAGAVLAESLRALYAHLDVAWEGRGLRAAMARREDAPNQVVRAFSR